MSLNKKSSGGDLWEVGGELTVEEYGHVTLRGAVDIEVGGEVRMHGVPLARMIAQPDSGAKTIADLVHDHNALLEKLRKAGLMEHGEERPEKAGKANGTDDGG